MGDGCWLWTSAVYQNTGYGCFWLGKKSVSAHRYAWTLMWGDIPKGLCVLHRCDNHLCVNPAHLFLGTNKDNTQDCIAKGRFVIGERNGMAKLTEDGVRAIREMIADGMRDAEIAESYGVDPSCIGHIRRGKTWIRVV